MYIYPYVIVQNDYQTVMLLITVFVSFLFTCLFIYCVFSCLYLTYDIYLYIEVLRNRKVWIAFSNNISKLLIIPSQYE